MTNQMTYMTKTSVKKHAKVTPLTLYSVDNSKVRSRSGAFTALGRLAVSAENWKEAIQLYKLAIGEAEERWGADSKPVGLLLGELAGVYCCIGEHALGAFYRRRSTSSDI